MNNLELLAPAGSPEALDAAAGEGADAVYLGLKDFNARMRSANFSYAQFEGALRSLHRMGKKVYVTVNTVFEQREADRMYQFLKYLSQQEPDAIIVQDFGVVEMARSFFPSLRIHASTQMNIASARGANALSRHGVSRVVLARELSLQEIRGIKKETNLELEVFVHGALCISVSGICLFSSFLGGKSANRGMCTQACRRLYSQYYRGDGEYATKTKAGAAKAAGADTASGYYFSPNDLQLLDRVPDLYDAGVKALKIEGRMKSASYVGAVVSAYRLVVDAVMHGGEDIIRRSIEQGHEILRNDFARAKTEYLFVKNDNGIDWLNPRQDGGTGINLGAILKIKSFGAQKRALVLPPRGISLSARDSVRIHHRDDSGRISHKLTFAEKQPSADSYWISVPEDQSFGEARTGDNVYLIQTKEMRKRYTQVFTGQSKEGKGPGREKAPAPDISVKKQESFPHGLYVAVSRPEDLYIVQSSRPQRVMLSLSRKTAKHLLADNKPPLPFKPAEIIITLEPFFPHTALAVQDHENDTLAEVIRQLINRGYHQYMVNNPGHISLFRGFDNIKLIAGPWLYTFNSWSLSFVSSLGVDGFVSPLENNRQNLEKTLGSFEKCGSENRSGKKGQNRVHDSQSLLHSKFFITVFAKPPLFSIRSNIDSVIKFNSFADNMGGNFLLVTDREGEDTGCGSFVYPQRHFSIIDKMPFLKEAGFARFIIDLNGFALKKSGYRDLMRAIKESAPLPDSDRFNWKDGFYSGG